MREWLLENNIPMETVEMLVDLSILCINQNIFMFRGISYKQTEGTSMGNALSVLVAEVYMSKFETKLERNPLFPRVYARYMDDIYAIIKSRKVLAFQNLLSAQNRQAHVLHM